VLASEVVARVRALLGDETAPYRWSDAALVLLLDAAEGALCDRRRELLLTAPGTQATRGTVDALTDTMTAGATHLEALALEVASRAMAEQQEGGADAQWSEYLRKRSREQEA